MDTLKIEEMEKMLKEAQLEKARLIESRVRHNPYLETDESSCSLPVNSFEHDLKNEGSGRKAEILLASILKILRPDEEAQTVIQRTRRMIRSMFCSEAFLPFLCCYVELQFSSLRPAQLKSVKLQLLLEVVCIKSVQLSEYQRIVFICLLRM